MIATNWIFTNVLFTQSVTCYWYLNATWPEYSYSKFQNYKIIT